MRTPGDTSLPWALRMGLLVVRASRVGGCLPRLLLVRNRPRFTGAPGGPKGPRPRVAHRHACRACLLGVGQACPPRVAVRMQHGRRATPQVPVRLRTPGGGGPGVPRVPVGLRAPVTGTPAMSPGIQIPFVSLLALLLASLIIPVATGRRYRIYTPPVQQEGTVFLRSILPLFLPSNRRKTRCPSRYRLLLRLPVASRRLLAPLPLAQSRPRQGWNGAHQVRNSMESEVSRYESGRNGVASCCDATRRPLLEGI